MKAVTTGTGDGTPVVADRADPVPGEGSILIHVRAAGINNADLLQVRGNYPAPPGSPPDIPGLELAGEVVSLGPGVTRFKVGDRAMAVVGGGGQAEFAVVHERAAMPIPDEMDWAEAGGFPEVFTTAHDALFTQAALSMGERVCIHGAAGGVGTAGVQLAAAAGARVIATVRRESARAEVEALADGVSAIDPASFRDHGPYDVILELIGAPNFEDDVASLASRGRITVIGVGGGANATLNLLALMAARGTISASTLRTRPLEAKADAARRVEAHVLPLVSSGRVRVPVVATFPLSEAAAAYARFTEGSKLGKIVLVND